MPLHLRHMYTMDWTTYSLAIIPYKYKLLAVEEQDAPTGYFKSKKKGLRPF